MSAASLLGRLDRSPRMSRSLPRLPLPGRRTRTWYRSVAHRYWRLHTECDELRRTVAHLEAEVSDLNDMLAILNNDLGQQRAQHTADLALLGARTRALRDVQTVCETARAAGVTTVNIDKVAAAADKGTW